MNTPPKWLMDAGLVVVVLFFFVAAIYYIYKIVTAVKSKVDGNGNGKRVPCLQSPQLQAIMTNQVVTMEAVRKIEGGGEMIKQNMILQTKLMEQFGAVLQKLSDCMVRQEATEHAQEAVGRRAGGPR